MKGSLINGGFGQNQETAGVIGGLELAFRFGVGLDGVLNESGDGLIFVAAGWRQDGSSSTGVVSTEELQNYGNLLAAIPGRSAFNGRLRLPFYVLPLDLLILAPVLYFIDQEALTKVGVTAVNGGLIPWQSGIETSVGRIQFVLGREVAVYFYGRTKERDALFNVSPDAQGQEQLNILSYRSTLFEFPTVEYRPFKTFYVGQRSSLFIQLYGGFDISSNEPRPRPWPRSSTSRSPRRRTENKGKTLCLHDFHKWRVVSERKFDVKRGKLVTLYRCERCGKEKTELV